MRSKWTEREIILLKKQYPGKKNEKLTSILNRTKEAIKAKASKLNIKKTKSFWKNLNKGKNNPMYGKHHTEEAKRKISKTSKGRKASKETRKKMSENRKGKDNGNWKGGVTKTIGICNICGETFTYYPKHTPGYYCSVKCANIGKRNRIIKTCEYCGKEFEIPKSENKKYNCCSKDCSMKLRHKNHIIIKKCIQCGNEFEVLQSRSDQIYCSIKCMGEHRKTIFKGRGNPNWDGGTVTYRGKDWSKKKRLCLIRDGFKCRRCKKENIRLHIHHIIPYKKLQKNPIEYLITLCEVHHRKEEIKYKKYGIVGWMKKQVGRNMAIKKHGNIEELRAKGRRIIKVND